MVSQKVPGEPPAVAETTINNMAISLCVFTHVYVQMEAMDNLRCHSRNAFYVFLGFF